MTKRRTILICIAGALAAIFVAQILFGLRSPQKNFKVKETPDFISIENSGETISLEKKGEEWFCAEKKADAKKVERLLDRFREVQTLGVAARAPNEAALGRYGLDAPIVVRAKSGEKNLRSIFIGKESTSGSQVYIRIEGKKEIYLAQGNLRRDFTFSADDILEKESEEKNSAEISEIENSAIEITE